jgi:hypothetical protein
MENIVIFNESRLTLNKTASEKMNFNCDYEKKKGKVIPGPYDKNFYLSWV